MKSFRSVLLVAALITCFSCSNDNNDPEVSSEMILGEWNLEEMSYSGTSTATMNGQTSSLVYAAEAIDMDAQVIFNDQSNYSTKGSYTIRMTTTMEGSTDVQDHLISNANATGTYRIEGNKIYTSANQPADSEQEYLMDTGEGTIMELTGNRMVIFSSEEVNTTSDGMALEVTMELIQILSR